MSLKARPLPWWRKLAARGSSPGPRPSRRKRWLLATALASTTIAIALWLPHVARELYPRWRLRAYAESIQRYAREAHVDPDLVRALVITESGGRPDAISSVDARGLMQLRLATAQEVAQRLGAPMPTDASLLDPEINLHLGTHYLAYLLERFDGNLVLALAAYNTGPTRIARWIAEEGQSTSPDAVIRRRAAPATRAFIDQVRARR